MTTPIGVLVVGRKAIRLPRGARRHLVCPLPGVCVRTTAMMNVDTEQPQYSGQAEQEEQEGQDVIWEISPLPSPPPRPLPSLLSSPLFSSPPPLSPPPPPVYLPTLHFDERGEQNVEDRPHSAARYPGHHADESSALRHMCVQITDPIGREVNETNFPEIFPAGEDGTIDPQLLECDGRVIDNLHGHNSTPRVSPEREPGEGSGSSKGSLDEAVCEVDAGNREPRGAEEGDALTHRG
ncbi:hypothetical protein EDB81DRAFT_807037, partial [Dactylonectria macrodidyma]